MAIQVWDETLQAYRGVELARYGADGTLAEALVWMDGQYRRVWSPSPNWSDDFTSPELHSRWMLMEGEYTPPGLSAGVMGPFVGEGFELTLTRSGSDMTGVTLIDGTFTQGVSLVWEPSGVTVSDFGGAFFMALEGEAPSGVRVGVRRHAGQWSLLVDGQVAVGTLGVQEVEYYGVPLTAPDPISGVDLAIILQGTPAAPITHVAYTVL